MYQTRADLAETESERAAFTETAAAYWRRAVQVPGIEPTQKAALEEKLDWWAYQDKGKAPDITKTAPSMQEESDPDISAPPLADTDSFAGDDEAARAEAPDAEFDTGLPMPETTHTDPPLENSTLPAAQ